jgi:16S rRNA (cytosine1402-N4)-methyltransferase
MHTPVLKNEVLEYLDPKAGQVIVDATFGAGGHSAALLERVGPGGKVIGLDRDAQAVEAGRATFAKQIGEGRLELEHAAFSNLAAILQKLSLTAVDGVLIDAGVSSTQLLSPTRGFSFGSEAPLDMRMDQSQGQTAAQLLATWSEEQLRTQLELVGERSAPKIARAIVAARTQEPIERADQLVALIEAAVPPRARARGIHVATKVFLALRMAVNYELEELQTGMTAALAALKPGGRLLVISFQSLEDTIVKKTFKEWAADCICPPESPICTCHHATSVKILTRKPVTPTTQERATNPRARSAKLRACQKL